MAAISYGLEYWQKGREVHVVSKYSGIEIDQIDLLVVLQLRVHVF